MGDAMAAPQFIPVSPTERIKAYESNDHVPRSWQPDRPGEVEGRQPAGAGFGSQGPDQGYGIKLANRFRDKLQLSEGEHVADAMQGCLNVALRRASLYGRAPVIHDFTMAFTMWGFLDSNPPAELVAIRKKAFEGVGHVMAHYSEGRAIVDPIPDSTFLQTPDQLTAAYKHDWRGTLGL